MLERIQEIIANELGVSKDKVTPDARLTEDLGADSLDAVEIMMVLEEEYGITIDDDNFQNIKTVNDIVAYIENVKK